MGLTRTTGPLSPTAPRTANYVVDGPPHKLLAHPFGRRVRAEFAGRTILDTRDGLLLHETALLPAFYVPFADIDPDVLQATDHTTHCPFKGDAAYHSLRAGDRVVENAMWSYPDPKPAASWLAGHASLYWTAADAWYDEDEQVFGHLTDPYTRVDIRPTSRVVEVRHGDTVIARSQHPTLLCETGLAPRFYLREADVVAPLEPSATSTCCPYKGEAGYRSVRLPDGRLLPDAAWFYASPLPESTRIAGLLSFAHDELTVLVDGAPA